MSAVVAPPSAGSSSLLSRYLSYPVVAADGSTRYLKGPKDLLFLLGAFAVLVVLREVTMRLVFAPCARRWVVEANGDAQARQTAAEGKPARPSTGKELRRQQKAATRFAEQGWSALYYTIFWSFGVDLFLSSTSYRPGHLIPFDFDAVWSSYPQLAITGAEKFYYLFQLAFYVHQAVIVNVEARRKDHWQMFSHHVVTIFLITGSILTNMSAVGIVVLVLLDFVDILLPTAKMLKYSGLRSAADAMFGTFVLAWLVTRQFGLLLVIVSVWEDAGRLMPIDTPEEVEIGPYDLHFTRGMWHFFLVFLIFIWILICIWFAMICNVVWKVLTGDAAEDTRSDDEEESEEAEDETPLKAKSVGSTTATPAKDADVRKRR